MKLTKTHLKQLIKEELDNIHNEGLFDKMRGGVRKAQQTTGIGKKPWKLRGKSNELTTLVDDWLSEEYKQYPELEKVATSIEVTGGTIGAKKTVDVNSSSFRFHMHTADNADDPNVTNLKIAKRRGKPVDFAAHPPPNIDQKNNIKWSEAKKLLSGHIKNLAEYGR